MNTKICCDCLVEKLSSSFHKKTDNSDGLKSYCRECSTLRLRKWREENPLKRKEHDKKYHGNYPEKRFAKNLLNRAVKMNRVKKLDCEKCGAKNSQAHHPDYFKPLEVIWLCPKHHSEKHQK